MRIKEKMKNRIFIVVLLMVFIPSNAKQTQKEDLGKLVKDARAKIQQERMDLLTEKWLAAEGKDRSGFWPIDSKSSCSKMSTRDSGGDHNKKRSASAKINSGAECGLNMFANAKMREDAATRSLGTKRVKRNLGTSRVKRSHTDKDMAENLLSKLEELVRDYRDVLEDDKDIDSAKKTQTRPLNSVHKLFNLRDKNEDRKMLLREVDEELLNINTIVDDSLIDARVVGGTESDAGKYPWMVALGKKDQGLCCGGTLITDQWVVTAAHCFEDEEEPCAFNCRLGSFDWIEDTTGHHVDLELERIVKHKDFNEKTLENDIAMVKLSSKVTLSANSYINNICINDDKSADGTECVAAGWGTEREGATSIPDDLQEVTLPVLKSDECGFDISDMQICAGSVAGGKDTCQGDSGGPLMFDENNRWRLTGITSFGNGCARAGWPGIYTSVPAYRDFMESVLDRY